jgi:hypothetical protein
MVRGAVVTGRWLPALWLTPLKHVAGPEHHTARNATSSSDRAPGSASTGPNSSRAGPVNLARAH